MRLKCFILFLFALCASAFGQAVRPEDGYYKLKYAWEFEEMQWSFSVGVDEELYGHYRSRTHYNDELVHYVLSEYDRPYIRDIVKSFRAGGEKWGFSDVDNLFNVVSFVQSLHYVSDKATKGEEEYVRYPIETLVDGCGDCEDVVILAAAILHEMGYDVLLVLLPEHLALAVKDDDDFPGTFYEYDGAKYYYLEMTDKGWDLGHIPTQYKDKQATLIPLVNRPVVRIARCSYQYDAYYMNATLVKFTLQCDLENRGPGATEGLSVHVFAKPNAKSNVVFAQQTYSLKELPEAGQATYQMVLPVPRPMHGVLEFRIEGENFSAEPLVIEDVVLE